MEKPDYRHSMVREFTPPWTRAIACSPDWTGAITDNLSLQYIGLSEYRRQNDQNYDAIYLSAHSVPTMTQEFILLFNSLAPGGLLILELDSKIWNRAELTRIGSSIGASLRFFGPANRYGSVSRNVNNVVVFQKEVFPSFRKKITVIVPILSARRDNSRVLSWLQFFSTIGLMVSIDLVIIFDGIPDTLPAWKECDRLETEYGFQMLRHYRPFGTRECMRSGLYFARGNYLLWDNHPVPCEELLCILAHLPNNGLRVPTGVFARAISSDPQSGKRVGLPMAISFFGLNRSAARLVLVYERNCRKYQAPLAAVQSALKKYKANIRYANVSA